MGTIGNSEAQKNKELGVLDKKREELSAKATDLSKRPCAATPELQVILLKNNSQLWDRIEVFERYAEQERALRIQAINLLRRHEEKMFGKIKEIETGETNQSVGSEGSITKRPRVNMMRVEEKQAQEDVDQQIRELIEKGEAITREFDLTQEENKMKQRRFNVRHKELVDQFHKKEMPCHKDLLDLSY